MSRYRDDWSTPQWLFDELDREFRFDLDAAAQPHNTKCDTWLEDALGSAPWPGRSIWCNPPYGGAIPFFVRKAHEEAQRGATIVLLIPVRTDREEWHEVILQHASEVRFVRNRIAFVPPPGVRVAHNRPVFASAIVIFDRRSGPPRISTMHGRRNSKTLTAGQRELVL